MSTHPLEQPPAASTTAEPGKRRVPRWVKITALVLLILVTLGLAAAIVWANDVAQPMPQALAAMQSDATVTVSEADWIEFVPATGEGGASPTTGFIFYPGGRVDPRAYAPPARELAAQGYFVAITPMPFNLAILDAERAQAVIAAHPEIERWVIGGHSLGGATAAIFADRQPQAVQGVVFWAAFPPDGNSLADRSDLILTSIYGTLDGLATPADIAATAPLLPPDAQLIPIEGGNHAQFGWYGEQAGDNLAAISREEQQRQVVAATLAALAEAAR
jgi:dienelactone hydrolase